MHEDQGMMIGPGQLFENVVIHLPKMNTNRTPGLKLVGISRANDISCLAVGSKFHGIKIWRINLHVTSVIWEKFESQIKSSF